MKRCLRLLGYWVIGFLGSWVLYSPPVFAAGEFSTSFRSTYTVNKNAETTASHQITLTNQQANTFASEYSLTIGSTATSNIKVYDGKTGIPFTSESTTNTTTVHVNLSDQPVVGIGGTKNFTIQYQDHDSATAVGKILEINIPKIANAGEFSAYETRLIVPRSFGAPTTVSPEKFDIESAGDTYAMTFRNHSDTGISAVFGSSQLFHVTLTYALENTGLRTNIASITLIPDTPYQRVSYGQIDPKPVSVDRDPDGNWIARYTIEGKEKLQVRASADVEIFMAPTVPIKEEHPDQYLSPSTFWQSDDPEIIELATQLQTPRKIYDYVVSHLSYDYSKINLETNRLGARGALSNPSQAICTEFTDVFIALARAAGIPARELNGFAYTQNPKLRPLSLKRDILHAWPEYWDAEKKQWIPVDPTWGNTTGGIDYFSKLDFNHVVFAIHGTSPTSPPPAGFFKTGDHEGKTIFVEPKTSRDIAIEKHTAITISGPKLLPSFFESIATVVLQNQGSQALYDEPISIDAPPSIRLSNRPSKIPFLLPGQETIQRFSIRPSLSWGSRKESIAVTIGDQEERYEPIITPPIISYEVGTVILALAGIVCVIIAARSWHLHFSRHA